MHPTTPLQRSKKTLITRYHQYKEIIVCKIIYFKLKFPTKQPLAGKNLIPRATESTRAKRPCIDEMQQLFACLKKWEFDDVHCAQFKEAVQRCTTENMAYIQNQKERMKGSDQKFHVSSEASKLQDVSGKLTLQEVDRLFRKYPQPDLGLPPYNVMKRMPHQSYADDTYHTKKWKGRKH